MGEQVAVVLEPPRPKSPPKYPDLCGRRRLQLELQILNREVDFLKVSIAGLPLPRPCSVPLRLQNLLGGRASSSLRLPFDLPAIKKFLKSTPAGSDSPRDLLFLNGRRA
jgi:hypothetical protein